jgi:endonuclease III
MVLQIKNNHKYVPVDYQERFQSLIDILLRENMSEDEFNTTLAVIVTVFPNTNKWLKWHLDND